MGKRRGTSPMLSTLMTNHTCARAATLGPSTKVGQKEGKRMGKRGEKLELTREGY